MKAIGPLKIIADEVPDEAIFVPLATYETTLWPSTNRGAKATRLAGGIQVTLLDEGMTRSITLQASSAREAWLISQAIETDHLEAIQARVAVSSRYAKLKRMDSRLIGNVLILRFKFYTADAAGHNMATQAAQQIQDYLLTQWPQLDYVSVSGNYCVDKKVSSVNTILGRGYALIAEVNLPTAICEKPLRTTPSAMANLHLKKNLIGSIAAGSLHSANAHFANLLLATYLATGQDAANIVEGSQGMTHAEVRDDALYFSVTLPNVIVGTVGHGKTLPFVKDNLAQLGCLASSAPAVNSRRLATIIAATVLCGELSLMAALTSPGELMRAHRAFERRG